MGLDTRTGRAIGDHGTADDVITFLLESHVDIGCNAEDFLKCWREGSLDEWPQFYEWLKKEGSDG